jgi:hypothetical protein
MTLDEKILKFAEEAKTLHTELMNRNANGNLWYVEIGVDFNKKFARVWVETSINTPCVEGKTSRSLFCWVALEDNTTKGLGIIKAGDILKGGWKAPEKGIRGHIDNWREAFSVVGHGLYIRYLR